MNICDLENRATPGPWHVHWSGTTLKDDQGRIAAETDNDCQGSVAEDTANARLIAHCRNNFLRALEALRDERPPAKFADYTMRRHAADCPCCQWVIDRDQLLAELEEVKA